MYSSPNKSDYGTQAANGSPGFSLKAKLGDLQEMVRSISEEINYHKKEVQILRSEKDTLEQVLSMKAADVRKSLAGEVQRVEEDMKRNFAQQKAENTRLQQQITALKTEKTNLQQNLLAIQKRIGEVELVVGADDI